MIQANELRIGNWVMYDGRYFQIECVSVHFPYLRTAEFGAGVVDWNNMNPIPLTEDILLKCGFEKKQSLTRVNCYQLDKIKVGFYSDGIEVYFGIHQILNIQYLHELQNLYYPLTKTELIINL